MKVDIKVNIKVDIERDMKGDMGGGGTEVETLVNSILVIIGASSRLWHSHLQNKAP